MAKENEKEAQKNRAVRLRAQIADLKGARKPAEDNQPKTPRGFVEDKMRELRVPKKGKRPGC